MEIKSSKKVVLVLLFLLTTAGSWYFLSAQKQEKNAELALLQVTLGPGLQPSTLQESRYYRTFTFRSFHGEEVVGGGFTFQYPSNWHNNGQYFSPQKINYYDITSVD